VATGNPTETSIGVPSKLLTVVPAELPQKRCPVVAPLVCSVHVTVPKTEPMVAPATDGTPNSPHATADEARSLRGFDISLPHIRH